MNFKQRSLCILLITTPTKYVYLFTHSLNDSDRESGRDTIRDTEVLAILKAKRYLSPILASFVKPFVQLFCISNSVLLAAFTHDLFSSEHLLLMVAHSRYTCCSYHRLILNSYYLWREQRCTWSLWSQWYGRVGMSWHKKVVEQVSACN